MKNKNVLLVLLLAIGSLTFSGCKKYPEGPGMSFRSAEARLKGVWVLVKQLDNGIETTLTADDKDDTWEFKESDAIYKDPGEPDETDKWIFADKKKKIVVTTPGGLSITFEIVRLTNKELWWKSTFGGNTEEDHFEKK